MVAISPSSHVTALQAELDCGSPLGVLSRAPFLINIGFLARFLQYAERICRRTAWSSLACFPSEGDVIAVIFEGCSSSLISALMKRRCSLSPERAEDISVWNRKDVGKVDSAEKTIYRWLNNWVLELVCLISQPLGTRRTHVYKGPSVRVMAG